MDNNRFSSFGKYRFGFPSWVMPGNIADNAAFICMQWERVLESGILGVSCLKTPEVALCFFESAACLKYDKSDLPPHLEKLPCTWHLHLPLDLPISAGLAVSRQEVMDSFNICLQLMRKSEYLDPGAAVLHPPRIYPGRSSFLSRPPGRSCLEGLKFSTSAGTLFWAEALAFFAELWVRHGLPLRNLLLENQPGSPAAPLQSFARRLGLGLCYDTAHPYMGAPAVPPPAEGDAGKSAAAQADGAGGADGQWQEYARAARIWHLNAPGHFRQGHTSLTLLSPAQRDILIRQLSQLPGVWPELQPEQSRACLPGLGQKPPCKPRSARQKAAAGQLPGGGRSGQRQAPPPRCEQQICLEEPFAGSRYPLMLLELFDWQKIEQSLPILGACLTQARLLKRAERPVHRRFQLGTRPGSPRC